jgi:hypothetical protein
MKWDKDFWYVQWPRVGLIVAIFLVIMLIFNSQASIGSYLWLTWLSVPLYMFHQYEEYVFPGGFQRELNSILLKDPSAEEKINSRDTFFINIIYIWVAGPVLIVLGLVSIIFPIIWVSLFIVNGVIHVIGSIGKRKYTPGLFFSIIFNLPLGIYILVNIWMNSLAGLWVYVGGIILGIILHALLFVILIAKTRRGN